MSTVSNIWNWIYIIEQYTLGLAKDLASVSLHAPSHTSNSTQTPKSSSNTTKYIATSSGGSARPTPTSSKSDASSAPKFSPGITLQRCGGFQSSNDTPCKRRVKSEPPFLRAYREDQSRDLICEPVEGLCNLHEEKVLYGQSEYKSKNGEWVNFESQFRRSRLSRYLSNNALY